MGENERIQQREILIEVSKGKFVPIGTAKITLNYGYYNFDGEIDEIKLKDFKILNKKEDIIWEKEPKKYC